MTPFTPLDSDIQWEPREGFKATKGYSCIFGSGSAYEAYLFIGLVRRLGVKDVLGAGCTEKEVEDLVESATRPALLFLVDGISTDCGVALVTRLKAGKPDLRAMLLVRSQEIYRKNPATRTVFDGIVAGGSVGRGGLLNCLNAVTKGESYLDGLLRDVEGHMQDPAWNDLNHREREILPLIAQGMKNKEIAAELFIAETTTRDYVSSILSKLNLSNRAQAAAWAIQHGLLGS